VIDLTTITVVRAKCSQEIIKGVDTVLVSPKQWDNIKKAMDGNYHSGVYQFMARLVDAKEHLLAYVQCVADPKFNTWVIDDSSIPGIMK